MRLRNKIVITLVVTVAIAFFWFVDFIAFAYHLDSPIITDREFATNYLLFVFFSPLMGIFGLVMLWFNKIKLASIVLGATLLFIVGTAIAVV